MSDGRVIYHVIDNGTMFLCGDGINGCCCGPLSEGSEVMEEVCGSCGLTAPAHQLGCQQAFLYQDSVIVHGQKPDVPHYRQGGIEPIDFINSWRMNFNQGNVVKYVTRYPYKGEPLSDLYKARQYLDWLIEIEERLYDRADD